MPDDTPHGGKALQNPPALPRESEPMAGDVEDENADPVVESGPGAADDDTGKPGVTRQPAP